MKALVLAGGSGTRFWPLSRRSRPKQLLALDGDRSLLQCAVDRLAPLVAPTDVWICTTERLRDEVVEQVSEVPVDQVLAEPEGRNTAAAIAWTVESMPPEDRGQAVVVLPADHRVADEAVFVETLRRAAELVAERNLVLALGVTPRWPETGYGYLELAGEDDDGSGVDRVRRFTEKPDRETAERFVASGSYRWNAGIFVFRGDTMLELVRAHLPNLADGLAAIRDEPARLSELYGALPSISIDCAIMEKIDRLATLPLDCGWSDLGSWQSLADVLRDTEGANVTRGHVVALESSNNLLWADAGMIAVLGVTGLTVVRTGDTVLIVPTERSQEVRRLVEGLVAEGREDLL